MMDRQIRMMEWLIKNAEALVELAKNDKVLTESLGELAQADKVLTVSLEKLANGIVEISKQPTETTPKQLGGSPDSA